MDHARVDHAGCAPSSDATGLNGAILCAERSGWFLLLARGYALKGRVGRNQQQFLRSLESIWRPLGGAPCKCWLSAVTLFQTTVLSVASAVRRSMGSTARYSSVARWKARLCRSRCFAPGDGYVENDGERYDFCVQVHTIRGCPAHMRRRRVVCGVARPALSRSEVLPCDQEAMADEGGVSSRLSLMNAVSFWIWGSAEQFVIASRNTHYSGSPLHDAS